MEYTTIYYYESGAFKDDVPGKNKKQSVLVTDSHGGYNFAMNKENFFLWSDTVIKYVNLKEGINNIDKYQTVNFCQNNVDRSSYFVDLRTSSDTKTFVFIVQQSHHTYSIFTWFTKENTEAEAYDVGDDYELIWDKKGSLYILSEDKVIFNTQRCHISTYDF